MTYTITFTINTDEDPSELLDSTIVFAAVLASEMGGTFDADTAIVEESG